MKFAAKALVAALFAAAAVLGGHGAGKGGCGGRRFGDGEHGGENGKAEVPHGRRIAFRGCAKRGKHHEKSLTFHAADSASLPPVIFRRSAVASCAALC